MSETTDQQAEGRENISDVEYPKPPYQGTRLRPVRIEDQLWSDCREIADARGESVSEVIRAGLERYRRRHSDLLEPEAGK